MLVLSRRLNQRIRVKVGDVEVWVTLVETDRGKVRLGFTAPRDVEIQREENLLRDRPPAPKEG